MSAFILGNNLQIVEGANTNKRFEQPQQLIFTPVLLQLPAHISMPADLPHYKSEILALAWKMHNWLLKEWELGRYKHMENSSNVPLEPFANMLRMNWPNCYEICGWSNALHSDRLTLKVYEENGIWTLEEESIWLKRHEPAPPPPVFQYLESQEAELDLVGKKLERLFSSENPNRISTVRKVLSPSGETFIQQMAKDFCLHLYVKNRTSSPAKHLTPELLLPILQQVLPKLITEELAGKANAPLAPLEELGAQAKAERERLEQAAGRHLPGTGDVATSRSSSAPNDH